MGGRLRCDLWPGNRGSGKMRSRYWCGSGRDRRSRGNLLRQGHGCRSPRMRRVESNGLGPWWYRAASRRWMMRRFCGHGGRWVSQFQRWKRFFACPSGQQIPGMDNPPRLSVRRRPFRTRRSPHAIDLRAEVSTALTASGRPPQRADDGLHVAMTLITPHPCGPADSIPISRPATPTIGGTSEREGGLSSEWRLTQDRFPNTC